MTTNGRLTTAEACELLDCAPTQLYRWRIEKHLVAEKEPTAGTGRLWWDRERVLDLAEELGPKRPGHTRRIKIRH